MIDNPNSNTCCDLLNGSPETTALDEMYTVARTAAQAVRRERERILKQRLFARLDEIKALAETEDWLEWRMAYELKKLATDFEQDANHANRGVSVQPPNSYEFGHPFKPRT